MSGIELVTLVSSIASAFSTSASVFQTWRAKRKAKNLPEKAAAESLRLEVCLSTSGPLVQAKYDRDFRYFGSRFSSGDDIARSQLQVQLICIQQSVIMLIQNALLSNIFDISYKNLLNTADSVRQSSITALAEQYQRLAATQPVRPALIAPITTGNLVDRSKPDFNISHLYCGIALLLQQTSGPMPLRFRIGLPCAICGSVLPVGPFEFTKETSSGGYIRLQITNRFMAKCHLAAKDMGFGCVLCERIGKGITTFQNQPRFLEHIRDDHGFLEYAGENDIS
ncbi:hypothetical protein K432DRAFT_404664 [Lepidopterella palustris CBS 459.81]|uniref:Uncharacterized protein n=1 Tax=Lepidopterella palustris CBS 459.81 TaxID=1314670 RepID=A0A8E2EB19_9PEZI|nr:hypothetical protein K432DRAFT_404664 [Lepidopterella palustris CBS 459.81]